MTHVIDSSVPSSLGVASTCTISENDNQSGTTGIEPSAACFTGFGRGDLEENRYLASDSEIEAA